jgi:hypothetical protein
MSDKGDLNQLSSNDNSPNRRSSHTESNKAQARITVTSGAAAPVSPNQNNLPTVERLLTMAATFYDDYTRDGTGNTYVKPKNAAPALFPSSNSKPAAALITCTCFNCGSKDDMLPDCPKPTDDKRIAVNKQKYLDAKKIAKANQRVSSAPASTPHGNNNTQPPQRSNRSSDGNGNTNGNSSERPSKWDPPHKGGSQNRFIWTRTHGNQPNQFNP